MIVQPENNKEIFSTHINTEKLNKLKRHYISNTVLFKEGERTEDFYILINGSVAVIKGNKKISVIKKTGDIFGEMSILLNQPRSATVVTEEPSDLVKLPGKKLMELANLSPDLSICLTKMLAERLLSTNNEKHIDNGSIAELLKIKEEYQKLLLLLKMIYKDTSSPQLKSLINFAEKSSIKVEENNIRIDVENMDEYLCRLYNGGKIDNHFRSFLNDPYFHL